MATNLEEFVAECRAKENELAQKSQKLETVTKQRDSALEHLGTVAQGLEALKAQLASAIQVLRSEPKRKSPPQKSDCSAKKAVTVAELINFLEAAHAENPEATRDELLSRVRELCEEAKRELSGAKERKLQKLVDSTQPQLVVEGVKP